MKNVVVFGGGTGLSNLLVGLKNQPVNITVVVTIADNGGSTGQIRNFYDIPAPGDIRRAVIALSEDEMIKELMDYRFDDNIDRHTIGNLVLTALTQLNENRLSEAVSKYCEILKVSNKILPISDESLHLSAIMDDGSIVTGESEISHSNQAIKEVFYEGAPKINPQVIDAINEADAIILSSGSLFTSIIPNIAFAQMYDLLTRESLKIIYVSNIVTQAGETDNYTVSDHLDALNMHLALNEVDVVISNNNYDIGDDIVAKYAEEHSQLVKIDHDKITAKIIEDNFITINECGYLRHDVDKVSNAIVKYLGGDDESWCFSS